MTDNKATSTPVARLCDAAMDISDKSLRVMRAYGKSGELRIPVLVKGTDLRVVIQRGPRIAALNIIEYSKMQATGRPISLSAKSETLQWAMHLIAAYAASLDTSDNTTLTHCNRTLSELDRMAQEDAA